MHLIGIRYLYVVYSIYTINQVDSDFFLMSIIDIPYDNRPTYL